MPLRTVGPGGWKLEHDRIHSPQFNMEDSARVEALNMALDPRKVEGVARRFQARVTGPDGEHLVGLDPVARQEGLEMVRGLIVEMLKGPHDRRYWMHRREAARRWVLHGLPPRRLFQAVTRLREDLWDLARRALPPRDLDPTMRSLNRLLDAELSTFSETWARAHEARQLRTLQDVIVTSMPVTILLLDSRGGVMAATNPGASLFGQPGEYGERFETFLPGDFLEASDLPSHVGHALATGTSVTIPRVMVKQGDLQRHLRVNVVPLEHSLARVLLHIEDITDVVDAEARARHAESLARIGALAANVAHEIRNPLSAISLALQVLETTMEPDDRRQDVLGKVQAQVTRMDRLVSDLLDYSRPVEPEMEPLDLGVLAAASTPAARVVVHEPGGAMGDPVLLRQVVDNLVDNAMEAAGPDGDVVIQVGPGPVLLVNDDGPGLSPEVRDRLFVPFFTTRSRGTGLGLAISRKFIEAMSGTIEALQCHEVPEGLGGGATFRITLASAPFPEASPADSEARTD